MAPRKDMKTANNLDKCLESATGVAAGIKKENTNMHKAVKAALDRALKTDSAEAEPAKDLAADAEAADAETAKDQAADAEPQRLILRRTRMRTMTSNRKLRRQMTATVRRMLRGARSLNRRESEKQETHGA